jgi:drug/metabolite transporter (DMT)-like permease
MLLASLGFSTMAGAAKLLKTNFNAGQLVFFRNLIGFVVLIISFMIHPPVSKGGKFRWLIFRGIVGTIALYSLLYCILHLPLATAMTYNLSSAIFIALFSFLLFKEYHGPVVLLAVILGFAGMLLVYKPAMNYPWYYHLAGLLSGITSAIAYITVGKLTSYYDTRVIVSAFIFNGVFVPVLFMLTGWLLHLPADDVFFIQWRWPHGDEWFYVLWLGVAALFGQYFVTRAYGADKAGIVSAVSYSSIIFSVFIGMMLGDGVPDWLSLSGIFLIISGGVIISFIKSRGKA